MKKKYEEEKKERKITTNDDDDESWAVGGREKVGKIWNSAAARSSVQTHTVEWSRKGFSD